MKSSSHWENQDSMKTIEMTTSLEWHFCTANLTISFGLRLQIISKFKLDIYFDYNSYNLWHWLCVIFHNKQGFGTLLNLDLCIEFAHVHHNWSYWLHNMFSCYRRPFLLISSSLLLVYFNKSYVPWSR